MRHRIRVQELQVGSEITVAGEEFHHAVRVARIREGEEVELFDGKGAAASAVVLSIGRDGAVVRVTAALASREAKLAITVAMSIIQLERFELVLQKVTELGARAIVPLVTDRAEVRPERYRAKQERWEKIVIEAVKQSGRAAIPTLTKPKRFDDVVAAGGVRIVFDADVKPSPVSLENASAVTLFIGPEGGWSDREIEVAREHGCLFARLGPRRLRAETAAIVATATIAWRFDELD